MPVSIRMFSKSVLRSATGKSPAKMSSLAKWNGESGQQTRNSILCRREIVLQDFTGVPADC